MFSRIKIHLTKYSCGNITYIVKSNFINKPLSQPDNNNLKKDDVIADKSNNYLHCFSW